MFKVLKKVIKSSFRGVGLELTRLDPAELNKFVWLRNQNIRTILDIGANTGQFCQMIHEVLPDAMIYSFEPLRDCYEQLVANMKDVPNFKAFNFALGYEDSETEIHRSDFSPSSSLLSMGKLHKEAFPQTRGEVTERIAQRRLDGIHQDLKLDGKLLIKIDVQGYEDKVIFGGQEVISRASVLIVETSFQSLYDGQPLFATIYEMLAQMGFVYHGNLDQLRNPLDGSILQADSIFITKREQ